MENTKITFEELMEREIPGYKELVSEERLKGLKEAFDNREAYDREAKGYLTYTSGAGIDYSNKFEKAMTNHSRWAMIFESRLDETKDELGINLGEKTSSSHR